LLNLLDLLHLVHFLRVVRTKLGLWIDGNILGATHMLLLQELDGHFLLGLESLLNFFDDGDGSWLKGVREKRFQSLHVVVIL
jgi:hypothetical protein